LRFTERVLMIVTTLRQQERDVLAYLTAACEAQHLGLPAPYCRWLIRPRLAVPTQRLPILCNSSFFSAGSRMTINPISLKTAVGSTKPVKVTAVQNEARRIWPEAIVQGVNASTGVSAMPLSDDDCITGARKRATAVNYTLAPFLPGRFYG
jgi:hypothetical protein